MHYLSTTVATRKSRCCTITTALFSLVSVMRDAGAIVIHVPADQVSIQSAIDAADSGDEVLVAPGIYREAINFSGKAITVRGEQGPEVTTIDATGLDTSVVKFVNAEGTQSILRGFTITGGTGVLQLSPSFRAGGGIYVRNASPTIVDCRVVMNTAPARGVPGFPGSAAGGGIYASGGSMLMVDCLIADNMVTQTPFPLGGGMSASGNHVLIRCIFDNNSAPAIGFAGTGQGRGGGLYADTATLLGCVFRENRASGASAWGGGAYGGGTYLNCEFTGNSLSAGGHAYGSALALNDQSTVVNCRLVGNHTSFAVSPNGSLAVFSSASTSIANCTIVGNFTSFTGPAVVVGGVYADAGAVVTNCIVFDNDGIEVSNSVSVADSDVEGGFPGKGNIDADPLFADPQNQDFRLQSGSPCRDRGSNDSLPTDVHDLDGDGNVLEHLSRDLGVLRRKVNGIVDMGAHEWQHTCPPDISPSSPGVAGNGLINIDDLLATITSWGACDACVDDIDGDDRVNVDDVLAVIIAWGVCP